MSPSIQTARGGLRVALGAASLPLMTEEVNPTYRDGFPNRPFRSPRIIPA